MSNRPNNTTAIAAIALAAVVASAINLAVGTLTHASGAMPPMEFMGLEPVVYLPSTVFGVIAGAIGWAVIRRRAKHPEPLLRRLVPIVVGVSFIPDLVLYFVASMPFIPVLALMVMHIVIAAISVPVYQRVLPVPDPTPSSSPT
ncbi:DUF6069 family protein [Saccharopolyspora phatthalungensis]|uniref:Uncharacterized protein n=1 Tax=Saccharopolyspora phatthalungensis TaxID=664693 RepID=A0A840QJ97_9PSEU|nr:DUF6069 family protein [Saccharopolyspora phatthalungensis]MBB5158895.1 hypothetical protein [Saccharopolyspora phatthalungensis]